MVKSLSEWTKSLNLQGSFNREKVFAINSCVDTIPQTSESSILVSSVKKEMIENGMLPSRKNLKINSDPHETVLTSVVFCIHHKDGCKWTDELKKLKAHLNSCKFDTLACPNNCNSKIPRIMIQDHLKFTCIKRRVNCKFCFKEFLGEEMENHAGSCDLEPIYCESKCGNKILRGNLSLHKSKICLKRLVPCNFCSKEFVIETITLHQKNCHLRHTSSKIQNSVLKAHDENIMVACLFADAGCKFKGIKSLLETHLESSTSLHLSMMVHYAEKQKKEIDMLKTTVKKLNVNYSGTLLWKITNWESRLDEAKRNENIELVSPNFYSSNYGYNLQVSVFPNGNGKGENTHMSVFIKILPGEFDALLKWPFDQKITFTLFEQSSEHDNVQGGIAESFTTSDLNWKNFKSPSEDADELGFGFPFFVSHDALKTRPFIRNNTVFLRIKCEPNKSFSV